MNEKLLIIFVHGVQ